MSDFAVIFTVLLLVVTEETFIEYLTLGIVIVTVLLISWNSAYSVSKKEI